MEFWVKDMIGGQILIKLKANHGQHGPAGDQTLKANHGQHGPAGDQTGP